MILLIGIIVVIYIVVNMFFLLSYFVYIWENRMCQDRYKVSWKRYHLLLIMVFPISCIFILAATLVIELLRVILGKLSKIFCVLKKILVDWFNQPIIENKQ